MLYLSIYSSSSPITVVGGCVQDLHSTYPIREKCAIHSSSRIYGPHSATEATYDTLDNTNQGPEQSRSSINRKEKEEEGRR